VTLTAMPEELPRGGRQAPHVIVSVADTGPGIAEADQDRIFEKFYQADASLTRETSGTGLGLAISKELAGLLGGRLAVQSTPGHGAVFTLALPVDPIEK
jgi:signal transduction histidine kinase